MIIYREAEAFRARNDPISTRSPPKHWVTLKLSLNIKSERMTVTRGSAMLKMAAIDGEVSITPRKKDRKPKRETKAITQSNIHAEQAPGRVKLCVPIPRMRNDTAENRQT